MHKFVCVKKSVFFPDIDRKTRPQGITIVPHSTSEPLSSFDLTATPSSPDHLKAKTKKIMDEEAQPLVVDNGSGMVKAGFAGDDAPRAGTAC